jgi:Ran GTPase-activating protein (RanGAP) involved in mRNA processing and transport
LFSGKKHQLNPRLEKIIAESPSHSIIDLRDEELVDQDMDNIVQQAMITKECTRLSLGGNKLSAIGAASLAVALSTNTTLVRLYLSNNRLSDKGVKLLAKALATSNHTLKLLNLQENAISDTGAEHVAEMLKTNTTLVGLWLDKNDIGNVGVRILADALTHHNTTLEYLGLSKNYKITDASVDALEEMLQKNSAMNELSIHECSLSRTSKERLRKMIRTKKNFSICTNSWDE